VSIFSAIGKAIGKVAKTGLSVATHGVSDKVLSALKSTGKAKKIVSQAAQAASNQAQATATKAAGKAVANAGAVLKTVVTKKTTKKAAKKKTVKKAATPKAKKAKAPKVTKNVKAKRTPPKGGLDLAKMAVAWRAAGKPGTWINWVKTMPIKKG